MKQYTISSGQLLRRVRTALSPGGVRIRDGSADVCRQLKTLAVGVMPTTEYLPMQHSRGRMVKEGITEQMVTALDAARYTLTLEDPTAGDLISNLKINKLLYYGQGLHLALHNAPLFAEKIEAWLHGPVCPNVYEEYRKYGRDPLPIPTDFDLESLTSEEKDVLTEVHTVYGQFSASRLRDMTHDEPPWRDYYREGQRAEIPHEALRAYFLTRLEPR